MDPATAQNALSKIPLLEQWPAVFVIVTIAILAVVAVASARLAKGVYMLAEQLGSFRASIQEGFHSVRAEIRETNHKLDRNTDLVNEQHRAAADLVLAEIRARRGDSDG